MSIKLGVVMDPIAGITAYKDTTLAFLIAAQARGWSLFYMEQGDLYLRDGKARASTRSLQVYDDNNHWFDFRGPHTDHALAELDVVLMRKDPPFDMEYIYTTYLLEHAKAAGVLVVNDPKSLRDTNEKLYTAWFPQCCPPTLVSRNAIRLRQFLSEFQDIILKPLDGMGGTSIFRLRQNDPNINVVIETLTLRGQRQTMAQRFIPEIAQGDKRILLIDGQPVAYALARIPAQGETRGNLAAGGKGVGVALTERDKWICAQVGPTLKEKGLMFVGLDVIGDYLTEINVTSPTCARELNTLYSLDIGAMLIDCIEEKLSLRCNY